VATVALSPSPPARRVAGTTGVFLFRRGEMPSWRSPPPGEPLTVVVVVLRREEYHVVVAVEGHELETPEAEHCPGLKRLLKSTHLELNGKVFVNTQQTPTWRANCWRFGPGGSLDRRVNLSLRAPAQMGWCGMEHKWRNEPCIILHQGACSRGYKPCERARARDRVGESERERVRPLLIFSRPFIVRLLVSPAVCTYARMFVCSSLCPPFSPLIFPLSWGPGHPLL
jgi:hypothetical protein